MVTVSIITPTYNRADTLPATVESVIEQSFSNFEYLIVDDGSTDNTAEVVNGFSDNRIKYIQLQENSGANVARNEGIKRSQGDYITFIDSDDRWFENRLERTVDALESTPSEVRGVTHSFESRIEGEVARRSTMQSGRIQREDLVTDNKIGGFSNVLFDNTIFDQAGLLDEEMPAYQDYEFYLRALQYGDVLGIEDNLCWKQKGSFDKNSEDRISDDVDSKIEGQNRLLEKHGEFLSEKVEASFYYNRGRLYMAAGDVSAGRRAFLKAASMRPLHPLYQYHCLASLGGRKIFKVALAGKRKVGLIIRG